MGSSSKPKTKTTSTLSAEQRAVSQILSKQIESDLATQPQMSEALAAIMLPGTEQFLKAVGTPMMRDFQTYVEPQIRQSFRQGGLWSKARGDATGRALGDLSGQLATLGAERDWQTSVMRAQMLERGLYDIPASQRAAIAFTGQQQTQTLAYQPSPSPLAQIGGMAAGAVIGGMTGGLGTGLGAMLGGGVTGMTPQQFLGTQ